MSPNIVRHISRLRELRKITTTHQGLCVYAKGRCRKKRGKALNRMMDMYADDKRKDFIRRFKLLEISYVYNSFKVF